ncbi:MAG: hypothetical protein JNJ69_16730 [Leptospiraceae bacterium]|nr:hypothetical protein [Leptospiraceae bacterium]
MVQIETSLVETSRIIANIDLRCMTVKSPEELPPIRDAAHFVAVNFTGLCNGILTLVVPTPVAFDLTKRVLSTAAGVEFAADQIDVDLINNTLGELANMSAGHYLRSNGLAADSDLFAPKLLTAIEVKKQISSGVGLMICAYQSHVFEALFKVA